jgi:serine/threonine protein kinase
MARKSNRSGLPVSPSLCDSPSELVIGRYILHAPIARGGMATIHIARLTGAEGFTRIVAAKRLHPELLEDAEFVAMFLDEARIASRISHPNVVPVLDVITTGSEIVLVQEYVHGVPLSSLLRAARRQEVLVPVPMIVTILAGVLAGLHGAHEAKDELGAPLSIVHRDVSPQNVMVTLDGTPRLVDFGVAKATLSEHVTKVGAFKGKLSYMAPEQLRGTVTRASDLYAVAVILWETLAGVRLHQGTTEAALITNIVRRDAPSLTSVLAEERRELPARRWVEIEALEPILACALARDPDERYPSAAEMEAALLAVIPRLPAADVGEWTAELGSDFLADRNAMLAHEEVTWRARHGQIESGSRLIVPLRYARERRSEPGDTVDEVDALLEEPLFVVRPPVSRPPEPRGSSGPPVWFWWGILVIGVSFVLGVFLADRQLSSRLAPPPTPAAASRRAVADAGTL